MVINPGIWKTVAWLNENGFETTDSGDGVTHSYTCDRTVGYVVIKTTPSTLVSETSRLVDLLKDKKLKLAPVGFFGGVNIQASYDPADESAIIDVSSISDDIINLAIKQ